MLGSGGGAGQPCGREEEEEKRMEVDCLLSCFCFLFSCVYDLYHK